MTGAFDINRRGVLALIGATGLTAFIPKGVQAAMNEIETVPQEEPPVFGMWSRCLNKVEYLGDLDSFSIVHRPEYVEFASAFSPRIAPKLIRYSNNLEVAATLKQSHDALQALDRVMYTNRDVLSVEYCDIAVRFNYSSLPLRKEEEPRTDLLEVMFQHAFITDVEHEIYRPLDSKVEYGYKSKVRIMISDPTKTAFKINGKGIEAIRHEA